MNRRHIVIAVGGNTGYQCPRATTTRVRPRRELVLKVRPTGRLKHMTSLLFGTDNHCFSGSVQAKRQAL